MTNTQGNGKRLLRGAFGDALIIFPCILILLFVFSHFNLIDSLNRFVDQNAFANFDRVLLIFVLMTIGLTIFAIRRWTELRKEIKLREQSEREIQASDERFRLLVNSLDDVVFTLDRRQRHTAVYGKWVQDTDKFRPDVFLGKTAREIWGPKDASLHESANKRALTGESATYRWATKLNGDLHHFQITVSPLRDELGEITGVVGVGHDITEKIHFERELHRHEQEMRVLLENAPDIVARYDKEGRFQYVNRVFENTMGVTRNKIVGKKIQEVGIPQELFPFWHQELERVVAEGKELTLESELATPAGMRYFHARIVPELNRDESVEFVLVVARDLTKHKRMEDDVRRSEEQLERILQTTPSGMTIVDLSGKIFFANKTAERLLGLETKMHSKQHYYNDLQTRILTVDGKPFPEKDLPYIQVMMTGEPVFGLEHAVEKHGGQRVILSVNAAPLHDYQGKVVGIISALTDITKLKLAEESARKNEQQFRDLADSISDVFFAVDSQLQCTYWNKASETLTGVQASSAIGKPITRIIPHISESQIDELCREALKTQSTRTLVSKFKFNGKVHYFDINVYPGKQGISVFLKDVSERMYAERERDRLITELQDALTKVKTLSGLLPICAFCKKIRDDTGYWHQVESYIKEHSEANFSHGVCPACAQEHYPEYFKENQEEKK